MTGAEVIPCDCGRVLAEDEHHCWWHHTDEKPSEMTYIVCGECFHVYETAADLEAADREHGGDGRIAMDIFACPLCIHDF